MKARLTAAAWRAASLLEPEMAHRAAILALKSGLLPGAADESDASLACEVFGLSFRHPLGLAAGFDKNAEAVGPLLCQGFSFVEAGTVTPRPQDGNPRPRLFRLREDEAVINRLGFNGRGMDAFLMNFYQGFPYQGIVGVNIGKNRDTVDPQADYLALLERVYTHADYITINISSPNTQGLRDLQRREALSALLEASLEKCAALAAREGARRPLLVKIAPDLSEAEMADVAEVALARGIDGLIVGNTTLSRPASLRSAAKSEQGGLSGRPLFALSTEALRRMYALTGGRLPLVGVGGIASGADAYAKIRAGASLLQLYTALVYQGFPVVLRIRRELAALLRRDGFRHVAEAIGADHAQRSI